MEAAIALSGQVAGRIDEIQPVGDIIASTVSEFVATIERLATGRTPSCPRTHVRVPPIGGWLQYAARCLGDTIGRRDGQRSGIALAGRSTTSP